MNEAEYLAAAKAFRDCRRNHKKSRNVCRYLLKQYLAAQGVFRAEVLPEIEKLLDEWYAARAVDAAFVPPRSLEAASDANSSEGADDEPAAE